MIEKGQRYHVYLTANRDKPYAIRIIGVGRRYVTAEFTNPYHGAIWRDRITISKFQHGIDIGRYTRVKE